MGAKSKKLDGRKGKGEPGSMLVQKRHPFRGGAKKSKLEGGNGERRERRSRGGGPVKLVRVKLGKGG